MIKKKTIEVEERCCDIEGCDSYVSSGCLSCGADHCHTCRKTSGHVYQSDIHFSTSNDGYYCNECIEILTDYPKDDLFNAYVEMNKQIKEYREFNDRIINYCNQLSGKIEGLRLRL